MSLRKLFNRLLGRGANEAPDDATLEIMRAYGAVMQQQAAGQAGLGDCEELPYTKEEIKAAIIATMQSSGDKDTREMLKAGYVYLASWQEGFNKAEQEGELPSLDEEKDPLEMAERLLEGRPSYEGWQAKVKAEQQVLQQELERLGLW